MEPFKLSVLLEVTMNTRTLASYARILLTLCTLAICTSITAVAQQPYQILDHWKIGGIGGWDYLLADPGAHLLYVTHGTRVEVLDTKTGKSVGAIVGLKSTHGVALDTDGRFGYISDGGSNNVVVFDRKTFKIMTTIPAGTNPDGLLFEPVTKTVWAFNGRSSDVSVIDAGDNRVVTTIKLSGKPEFPVADGKGSVFVNIETANSISRIDAKTRLVTATWKLADCESPSGLAIDQAHRKLFAVCDAKKMAVVDADSGKQIATPTIGDGPDAAGYSDRFRLAFASAGEGKLTIVDTAHNYKVLETLPTEKGARTMTYDSATDRVYLVTGQYGPLPAPTPGAMHPRPQVVPDSFTVIVVGRSAK
jgi:YVTN family beta-propeller protein